MPLTIGSRLGSYEILALIGEGGMGQVYRARDTKLNREVALKVLPEAFAADPDRLARFKREAQVLASLNHPNIAAIYGLEEAPIAGTTGPIIRAIVMELVEGPTLGELVARQNRPESGKSVRGTAPSEGEARQAVGVGPHGVVMNDVLAIARQIADALEGAHEQAVVHRDLKPANIKVRPDGVVKVLDFGLAAVVQAGPADPQLTNSPTLSLQATRAGLIMGTAGYMSPEQASGKAVDKRADIWAFGVVLWELLTGRRLFEGETIAHTLAGVLTGPIDLTQAPAGTPVAIRDLLGRCLDRDARRRLRDIGEARLVIEQVIAHPEAPAQDDAAPASTPSAADLERSALAHPAVVRKQRLWIAATGVTVAALGAVIALWAPWRAPAAPPVVRTELVTPDTGDTTSFALSPDGTQIVFVATGDGGASRLWLRPLATGAAQQLPGTDGASAPFWSPDGRSVAFFGGSKLKRLDLGGGVPRDLANAFGGWLVWAQAGALLAQRLDLDRRALIGEPVTISEPVSFDATTNAAAFSVSASGLMAFRSGGLSRRQLQWFDRAGKPLGTLGPPDEAGLSTPRVSPDGRRVSVWRMVQGSADIWLLDGERRTRFTFDASLDRFGIWSPDGRIAFDSTRRGVRDLFLGPSGSPGSESLLLESPLNKAALHWSADGRYMLYGVPHPEADWDLWVLPTGGDRQPWPFLTRPFADRAAQFSPDGHWVAYQSNESGSQEVFVRPFEPDRASGNSSSAQWQVSTAGGIHPRWRPDGRELYYLGPNGQMIAVPISVRGAVVAGAPVTLFQTRILGGGVENSLSRQYDVAPDGRFLINTVLDEAAAPITLLQNWTPPAGR